MAEPLARVGIVSRHDLLPPVHGAAVKIVRGAESLARQGLRVVIVVPDKPWYLVVRPGGGLAHVPFADSGPPPAWFDALVRRAVAGVGYPETELLLYRPIFDVTFWWRLYRVARRESLQLLQAEFPGYAMPARVVGALRRIPVVAVAHNVEWQRLADTNDMDPAVVRRMRKVELGLLSRVDRVVPVSPVDAEQLIAGGVPRSRVEVIPLGVDFHGLSRPRSRDKLRRRFDVPEDAPLLFFHGTLDYQPNREAVAFICERLMPDLWARGVRAYALIAGKAAPSEHRHLGVRFTGVLDDLGEGMFAADLAVVPLWAGSGTRLKLLEYFAAGMAVVSTRKGAEGLPLSGDELRLIDDEDAAGFVDATAALLSDPLERVRLGEGARRYARSYDWDTLSRRYLALYRELGVGIPEAAVLGPAAQSEQALARALRGEKLEGLPRRLMLLLNDGCNLRCSFCDLWDGKAKLDEGLGHRLLREAAGLGVDEVVLTGGEPLLHPGVFALAEVARREGLHVNITTNGTLLARHADPLLDAGIDSLSISVDGLAPVHDALRGRQGAFQRTLDNLRDFRRIAEERGSRSPRISLHMVVTRHNAHQIEALYELAQRLELGFDFWPVNDAEALYLRDAESIEAYLRGVDALARRAPIFAERRDYYRRALRYHAADAPPMRLRCLALGQQLGVDLQGRLIPCCVWGHDALSVGNVKERSLGELWRSPEADALRRRVLTEGCTVGCYNHSLHELSQATGLAFEL